MKIVVQPGFSIDGAQAAIIRHSMLLTLNRSVTLLAVTWAHVNPQDTVDGRVQRTQLNYSIATKHILKLIK